MITLRDKVIKEIFYIIQSIYVVFILCFVLYSYTCCSKCLNHTLLSLCIIAGTGGFPNKAEKVIVGKKSTNSSFITYCVSR